MKQTKLEEILRAFDETLRPLYLECEAGFAEDLQCEIARKAVSLIEESNKEAAEFAKEQVENRIKPMLKEELSKLLTSQVEKIREEVVDGYLKSVKENGFVKPSVLVVLYGEAELYLTQTEGGK